MKFAYQKELDEFAKELVKLREKAKKSKNKAIKQEYKSYQNFCFIKFKPLVLAKVAKYKKFSNYKDLEQDGFEALVLAVRTYNPEKGSFTWWADKYISTRVARAANTHSTIRFPLKKAKDLKPFKTSTIPLVIDSNPDVLSILEDCEQNDLISKAIASLPRKHRKLIKLIFGFQGKKPLSIGEVIKELSITRPQCLKMLEEAKLQLKEKLTITE